MRRDDRLCRQLAQLVHDLLLRIGRDRRLDLLHREDDVLFVLGDLRQHR
jgi:hypothetical protein